MKLIFSTLIFLVSISAQAKTLSCSGTEPFWGATIDTETGKTKIGDANHPNGTSIDTTIRAAAGATADYAFIAEGKFVTYAVVGNDTCSDGMSEQKYSHSIMVIGYSKEPFVGCCL